MEGQRVEVAGKLRGQGVGPLDPGPEVRVDFREVFQFALVREEAHITA